MKSLQHVAIVGAGLVGCLLARLLALRGYRISLFEKRGELGTASASNGRSTHLVVSSRGWSAIEAIGAREAVLARSMPLSGRSVHMLDGQRLRHSYAKDGSPIFAIPRGALNDILLELAVTTQGVTAYFGHQCVAVEAGAGRLTFELSGTGGRRHVQADWIFAADGAFSAVRTHLQRRERLDFSQNFASFGYKELRLSAGQTDGFDLDAMHAWPRGRTSLFAFPNRDGTFTATLLAPFEGDNGFDSLHKREDVVRLFGTLFPDINADAVADEFFENPVSSLFSARCRPWTFAHRVALIGDAAHAMLPFLGQGMNAGFEDCMEIASLLEEYDEDFDAVLRSYEALRKPNCDAVTELSTRAFEELTVRIGDNLFGLRKLLEQRVSDLSGERLGSHYELIAFTHKPYVEALKRANELDAITAQVAKIPGIETIWSTPEGTRQIDAALEEFVRAQQAGEGLPTIPYQVSGGTGSRSAV